MRFYSPIDRLAQTLPRPKGTGAEFMTELSKMPGYKPQEAEDRGLQALANLPKMERAQFMEALRKKQPVVPEVKTLRTNDEKRYGPRRYDQEEEEQMPRHESFTLPGGSNYREILLKHPQGEFKGVPQHFGGEPNILASVRAKDRLGPNGEKILHIEELQSDWHQQGRDKGYTPPDVAKQIKDAERAHRGLKQQLKEAKDESNNLERYLKDPSPTWQNPAAQERVKNGLVEANNKIMELMPQVMKAEAFHQDLLHKSNTTAPDAPFKKNWHEMALKKMIHHAAKNGYDAIAITPGAEQAERYGLAKHVDQLIAYPDGMLVARKNGANVVQKPFGNEGELAQLIGKEAAAKLLSTKPDMNNQRVLGGQDLNIGGEGMKGFYDKIVPNFLNQFGKKYGAKVGQMPLAVPSTHPPATLQELINDYGVPAEQIRAMNQAQRNALLDQYRNEQKIVHHFPITPEMREDVVKNGVPLYADGGAVHMAGGSIKELENYIRQSKGEYGAKRVQRAADEIPNLERMYTPQALRDAFGGDNAKALMTMNPADFEKFAVRLFSDPDTREEDMAEKIERDQNLPPMSHHDYIKYLASIKGGFADAPFLEINKRLGYLPNISGHEGRHRSRALASMNAPKSLVRLLPSSSMREDMPRRRQEEFIEAMKKELGEKRLVTGQGRSLLPADLEAPEHKNIERRNMLGGRPQLPDIYADGGAVKPIGYTKEQVTVSPNLDAMRYEMESVKHYTKKVK